MVDFKNIIQSDYDLIDGVQDVLYLSAALRDNIDTALLELIDVCDKVITDTTGRLAASTSSMIYVFSY